MALHRTFDACAPRTTDTSFESVDANPRTYRKGTDVPSIPLPNDPDLEHLKAQAKLVKQLLADGDQGALDMVAEFHPRFAGQEMSAANVANLKLSDTQLMVARLYGFESWPKLRGHIDAIAGVTRSPDRPAATSNEADLADTFLRLACHDYENNPREREAEAQAFLAEHPDVATASIFTMAAVGDAEGVAAILEKTPGAAMAEGGPHRWPPLLHLCYSRITPTGDSNAAGWSAIETMRVLLDAGADPNSGFLWRGNVPPFSALTGVIGGGERDESPHRDDLAMARMLLEAGADPNDGQALYNKARHDHDDTDYLQLLFEFGLGTDKNGPWYQQFGTRLHSPVTLVNHELENAANGKPNRMWVLIDYGVNPDQPCGRSRKTPVRIAADGMHYEVLDILAATGIDTTLTPIEDLCRKLLTGPASVLSGLASNGSTELATLQEQQPGLIATAGTTGRFDLIGPLVDAGFDINARFGDGGITALHEAASTNNVDMARALVEHGADPTITDANIGAPPIGWAHYEGHTEVATYLESVTPTE